MNKKQEELLNKAQNCRAFTEIKGLKGVFVIQQRKLHDSGYRIMYVIGHSDYDEKKKDFDYYLLSCGSDVVQFETLFGKINCGIKDLHMDIDRYGIIHLWSRINTFKCEWVNVSSCILELEK